AKIKELVPTVKEVHTINFGMQHFPSSLELRLKEDIILSNRLHKPLYNIDKIISGFAKLVHENPSYAHFKLVIVASGTETEKLNCLSKNLGVSKQVHFTGMLSYLELISWYKRAKIFVSIPNSDATSLSVLEAMGYGCYPILSNLPANLEWVLDNINGQICQNLDLLQIELTKAIKYLTNSANYWQTAQFNYALIKQKAVFEDNMEQFFSLY
ncbi:MAG: glycosyltransferase, partial [Burkholderiales bacterium]